LSNEIRIRTLAARQTLSAARSRRGIASIEFAIVTALIITIVLGTYDLGGYVLQQMALAEAAYAGGQDAVSYPPLDISNSNDPNTQNLINTIQNALPANWVLGGDTQYSLSMTPTCGNATPSTGCLVTINLTRDYTALLIPGIAGLSSTSATYVARIQ
jgi:Flp pilus assembly protein TadG